MRLLILSVAGWLAAGLVLAGDAGRSQPGGSDMTQLPVNQTYKDPQYQYWDTETGQLKFTLTAREAKGITVNRAETTDMKIQLYTAGKVTTTITSPDADLYVADRKMRTHNTVKIVRDDMTAAARFCDFDLAAKQYTLRDHVKVTLLHFDMNASTGGRKAGTMGVTSPPAAGSAAPRAAPAAPSTAGKNDSLLESPGSFSSTNNAPASP
jgi:hypothetical protein